MGKECLRCMIFPLVEKSNVYGCCLGKGAGAYIRGSGTLRPADEAILEDFWKGGL